MRSGIFKNVETIEVLIYFFSLSSKYLNSISSRDPVLLKRQRHKMDIFLCTGGAYYVTVRHVTGTGSGLLGEIPRVVVQKSALL